MGSINAKSLISLPIEKLNLPRKDDVYDEYAFDEDSLVVHIGEGSSPVCLDWIPSSPNGLEGSRSVHVDLKGTVD